MASPSTATSALSRRGYRLGTTSRYRGVTLFANVAKYEAFVKIDGQRVHLGMWRNERDVPLNLPRESTKHGPCDPEELRRLARIDEKNRHASSRFLG